MSLTGKNFKRADDPSLLGQKPLVRQHRIHQNVLNSTGRVSYFCEICRQTKKSLKAFEKIGCKK